jgi:hypothetical protein
MKVIFTIILSIIMTWGMNEKKGCADISNPNPDWVKEIINKKPKFTKVTHCMADGMEVWKVNSCVTCHDKITKVYDRKHQLVCQYGGIMQQNTCIDEEITFQDCEVIYRPRGVAALGL